MRKILFISLLMLCFFTKINVNAQSNTEIIENSKDRIYDLSDVLSDGAELNLSNYLNTIIKDTTFDIYVIITEVKINVDNFYNQNKLSENSIVLMINSNNKSIDIHTYGLAVEYYNNDRINTIIKAVNEKIENDEYYFAILAYGYNIKNYYVEGIPKENLEKIELGRIPYLLVAVLSLIITGILVFIIVGSYKKVRKAIYAERYINDNRTKITNRKNLFVKTKTIKVHTSRRKLFSK